MKRKSSGITIVLAVCILFMGCLIFLYPIVSSHLAKLQQENVIVGYEKTIQQIDESRIQEEWKKAVCYDGNLDEYEKMLNLEENGVMGYIDIPKIDARLPIYHYATEESIQKGVGHMEQTDLPIGGKGSHSVLTGHRGLPNAELFTRLDELKKGDIFYIYVLDKILAYEVNGIRTVLPEKINSIKKELSKDQITLVTCTPYGVNTHRLLVTGERTEYIDCQNYHSEKQDSKSIERNKIIFYTIIIFTGLIFVTYPLLSHRIYVTKVRQQKEVFISEKFAADNKIDELYQELEMRNMELYLNGQSRLTNESAYQKNTLNLKKYGLNDNIIGFITVPKMNIELPVLLGASEKNMKKGAVHLTETSYPIGGENTNCVIAAHRGYSKTAMFRNIDRLKIGDSIYVKNFRGELEYKVIEIKIISPKDTDNILIKEGKDMLTLITCHPYRKNSHRFVVFCERV